MFDSTLSRRNLLQIFALSLGSTAGCLSFGSGEGSANLVVINRTTEPRELAVTIEENGSTVFTAELTVAAVVGEPSIFIEDILSGQNGDEFQVCCTVDDQENIYEFTYHLSCIGEESELGSDPKDTLYIEIPDSDTIQFDESTCG